jgi:predicted enzyme related to lactoylglutathione lyase
VTSTVRNIAFDCAEPYALAQFWSQVLGHPLGDDDHPLDPEVAIEQPGGPAFYFAEVPEPKTVKNRVHVCLRPDIPRDAEVERLLGLGASVVADRREPDGLGWVVLADPEGNEFCVLRSLTELGGIHP